MTTSVYLSAAVAHRAEQVQENHRADPHGWCAFCLRHHRTRVRAGECEPFQRAAAFIRAYDAQRRREHGQRSAALARPSRHS